MAWMEAGFEYGQEMRQWVSPSLIEANYILSLSQQELQSVIEAEMAQNPALELDDRPTCPVCDSVLEGRYCTVCRANQENESEPESIDSMDDNLEPPLATSSTREDDPEFDPMTLVASSESVLDQGHQFSASVSRTSGRVFHETRFGVNALDRDNAPQSVGRDPFSLGLCCAPASHAAEAGARR